MAALSVHIAFEGRNVPIPAAAPRCEAISRRREFADTPPVYTSLGTRSRFAAESAFPTRTSTTASWKDAATSSTRAAFPSGEARNVRSAVFSPEKEKSAESRQSHARGKWNRDASPAREIGRASCRER